MGFRVAAVPDVPLIEGEGNPAGGFLFGGDEVADCDKIADLLFQELRRGEEGHPFFILRFPAEIGVQREVVGDFKSFAQHRSIPGGEGRHRTGARPADDKLNRRIRHLHHLAALMGDSRVFLRALVADLPGPVHFVAEAPETDAVRCFRSVFPAQVAPTGSLRKVAVFDQLLR